MNSNIQLTNEAFASIKTDRLVRQSVMRESFNFFFHGYLSHYVQYDTAPFQLSLIKHLEDSAVENLYVMAFRGSGKSTIATTAYPIWAILGWQQKKFVVILCHTQAQAKQHMMNIRNELESNQLLKSDLGPFKEIADEWDTQSLVFNDHAARITITALKNLAANGDPLAYLSELCESSLFIKSSIDLLSEVAV